MNHKEAIYQSDLCFSVDLVVSIGIFGQDSIMSQLFKMVVCAAGARKTHGPLDFSNTASLFLPQKIEVYNQCIP